jgi:hypothetical protein
VHGVLSPASLASLKSSICLGSWPVLVTIFSIATQRVYLLKNCGISSVEAAELIHYTIKHGIAAV